MIRNAVLCLHGCLAALTTINAVILLVQGQMNLAWETGFYQIPSVLTQAYIGAAIFAITLAFLQFALIVGVVFKQPWAIRGLLALTVLLSLIIPMPWNILLLLFTWTAAVATRVEPKTDPVDP